MAGGPHPHLSLADSAEATHSNRDMEEDFYGPRGLPLFLDPDFPCYVRGLHPFRTQAFAGPSAPGHLVRVGPAFIRNKSGFEDSPQLVPAW